MKNCRIFSAGLYSKDKELQMKVLPIKLSAVFALVLSTGVVHGAVTKVEGAIQGIKLYDTSTFSRSLPNNICLGHNSSTQKMCCAGVALALVLSWVVASFKLSCVGCSPGRLPAGIFIIIQV